MSHPVVAAIRSVVQAIVSLGVVAVANVTLFYLNVQLEVPAITESLSLFAFGLLVWLFNVAGDRWPVINTILSLGQSTVTPTYFEQ